jgi:enolase
MPKTTLNQISNLSAREILNSSGYPTLEASLTLSSGQVVKASVPVGIRSNNLGAQDLYDGDKRRYQGRGVLLAANHINEVIAPRLKNISVLEQEKIDLLLIDLDASSDRRQLGANTMTVVSLVVARAAALSENKELFTYLIDHFNLPVPQCVPAPLFNMFNGGRHADTNLDFQEFLLVPHKNSPAFSASFCEGKAEKMVRAGTEIFHVLGRLLLASNYDTDTGLEGGYAPDMDSSLKALEMMMAAVVKAGYKLEEDFSLGLDIGSSYLYDEENSKYIFTLDNGYLSSSNLISLYDDWLQKYPLIYLEDGIAAEDWPAWREATTRLGSKLILAGDDLFVSSLERLRKGIAQQTANAIVIKPNQIGTLTETIECAKLAHRQNYKIILSHRGGETNDDFIVDLATAVSAEFLKAGAPTRGERVAKYNRLMEIADIMVKMKN